ncbi:lipopolysaccharide heptosyltransferase I [Stutzerimonas zhaodongensis]|uniref:Lipopolysaccharide heptosyltransferase 1 n=1 Tax=Stutzerimonas zhaodongensis TaxID=1176257 RepID=A0A3M2I0E5_9GAMM|nr:lipopolysaccharide heptosyltransferase I [Stutzerimonas zhaodongensis]MCQ2028285.1 lipopolysaccharide heptosyltransferase I [Stutzerimonas zhaodongensis]MCQ4315492.1 lipopolysaccharide heptosyltransferase I [Stutzerimonas zhaodongensis]RMH91634.1 lipopolysaccharide heptosyltransferase I [Stutzerimonas zhaodongensis]
MRVLLVKTSSLGDVVHTLPALTDAQQSIPGIEFDWVVEEGFAEIPAWHPAVSQVIPVAIRRWRRHPFQALRSGEWSRFKSRLSETRYDLVIDAQGLVKSAWLTRYVKAPVAGLDRESAREPLASRFYDRRYAIARDQHALERVRQLFAQSLGYSVPETVADYGLDRNQLATPGDQPYLLFLHGTTWASKHWPEDYWRELAERMSEFGWSIRLPWGNADEKARAERIAEGLSSVSVLPKLNLGGIAKVVAGARACVAVDTGLGHLAAALDVPSISLYGPTLPGRVGAYGRSQIHLCASGPNAGKGDRHKPCFDDLPAERVASELKALLRSSETT